MDAPDTAPTFAGTAPDARALAADVLGLIEAWYALLQAELQVAGRSLRALAIGLLVAPVLLLGLWGSAIGLLLIALHAAGLNWLAAGMLNFLLQGLLVWGLLHAARRWSRDVSLRRTRAVLIRLLEPRP